MNILNLHGYKGNSENTLYQILKDLFPDAVIHSPAIDYDNLTPKQAADDIASYTDEDLDLIAGTSLGGFFALNFWAGYSQKCSCAVLNPALHPWELLPKLGYNKADNLTEFNALYNENFAQLENFENLLVLSGKDDNIVGDLSEEPVLESRIKRINCGHSAYGNAEATAEIKREIIAAL
jgi:predicted esterase YcpF (UPF0227 family)